MELLTVENLNKHFGAAVAVDGLSFSLSKGKCTSLLGPNGAGKTTTLRMLSGLTKPTSGQIRFAGFEGSDIRRHIGYLPQYPAFYKWMSAVEYMVYTGQLFGLEQKTAHKRGLELLEQVGLKDAVKRRIGGFSGGMKQRLGIAQALVNRPALLILDEPVSALDPIGRREVMDLIRRIREDTTVLFSTHVLHDAEEISDDVLIMQKGKIAVAGSLEQLRQAHTEPFIRVEFDRSAAEWAEGLRERVGEVVKGVLVERFSVRIEVDKLEEAMPAILADLSRVKIPVRKVEGAGSSLEELFMKVVGV